MRKLKLITLLLFVTFTTAVAQKKDVVLQYISTYKDIAISEMKRTGVPAAITLAQGIHESGAGNSKLVLASNNHFGIKCKSNWTGESVKHDDDAKGECFRKYPQPEDSYRDHSDFLKQGKRYAFLFELDPADYEGWANGLSKAGYATNPKYPQVLIKLIEDYDLQSYTLFALGQQNDHLPVASTNNISSRALPKVSYPEGKFRINDCDVVFVQKGESFLNIATRYDVSLAKIFEYNELVYADFLQQSQLIFLEKKKKTGAGAFHIAADGETLYDIAQAEGVRLSAILEMNRWKEGYVPSAGEKILLR